MPPHIDNFAARISKIPMSGLMLIVVGQVLTSASNLLPKLTTTASRSINPAILLLDLTIEDSGSNGAQADDFRGVRFEIEPSPVELVKIFWEGEFLTSFTVGAAK